jgi:hypothetical protein
MNDKPDLKEMEESKKINEMVNILCVSNVMYDNELAGIKASPSDAAKSCAEVHSNYIAQLDEYLKTNDLSKLSKELYFVVSYLKFKKDHTEILN